MPDSWLPNCWCMPFAQGAWSAGGQKCRWNDLVQRDLVKCGIEQDWRKLAQDRSAWRGVVEMHVDTINKETERKEDRKKDERKRRQQSHLSTASARFVCDHPNCNFRASNRAGLVNHRRQKHDPQTIGQCNRCGKSCNIQGLPNHKRFCAKRH